MQALRRLLRDILQIGGIAVALHCGGTPLDERVATVVAAKVAADKKVQEALVADMATTTTSANANATTMFGANATAIAPIDAVAMAAHYQTHFQGEFVWLWLCLCWCLSFTALTCVCV